MLWDQICKYWFSPWGYLINCFYPSAKKLLKQEGLILLLVTVVAGICLYNGFLGRLESLLLIALVIPLLFFAAKYKKNQVDTANRKLYGVSCTPKAHF